MDEGNCLHFVLTLVCVIVDLLLRRCICHHSDKYIPFWRWCVRILFLSIFQWFGFQMSGIVCILFVLFVVAMMYMSSRWSIFSTFAVCVCDSLLFIGSVGWS